MNICGWILCINKQDLLDHPDEMDAALEYLHARLYQVTLNVPRAAVTQTRQRGPLWFEYDTIANIACHGRSWLIANKYKPPDVGTVIALTGAETFIPKSYHRP